MTFDDWYLISSYLSPYLTIVKNKFPKRQIWDITFKGPKTCPDIWAPESNLFIRECKWSFVQKTKRVLWGHSDFDLGPPNSNRLVFRSKWAFVPNMKKRYSMAPTYWQTDWEEHVKIWSAILINAQYTARSRTLEENCSNKIAERSIHTSKYALQYIRFPF